MSVSSVLGNPWVLGAGAVIGVVLLFTGKRDEGVPAVNAAYTPAMWTENVRANAAIAQTALQSSMALDTARVNAGVTRDVAAMRTLQAMSESSNVLAGRLADSRAGVIRAIATTDAAVAIDRNQNFARLGMTAIQADTTKYVADIQYGIAVQQAKAMKNANMWQGIAGITKSVGDVAKAAILA